MTDIILRGTLSEILQHHAELIGHELTVIIHRDAEIDIAGPEHLRIRDEAHLKELLLEGWNSGPSELVTEKFWEDIRAEVRTRSQARAHTKTQE